MYKRRSAMNEKEKYRAKIEAQLQEFDTTLGEIITKAGLRKEK